jgi:RNA 2',3'-cyclic 3'-phosphodiesterase
MKYRTFIALETPQQVHTCLTERLLAFRNNHGVNWVAENNLHLTLLFLGDVEQGMIPELKETIKQTVKGLRTPELALRGLELFPARAPRLIWASLDCKNDIIYSLHKELLYPIRQMNIEPDIKQLKLHITLGRIKSSLPVSLEREIMQSPVKKDFFGYNTLTLYRSVLKPGGPTYHILEQFSLT